MLNSFPFVAYQRLKVIAIANSHSAKLTPFTRNSVAFQRSSAALQPIKNVKPFGYLRGNLFLCSQLKTIRL